LRQAKREERKTQLEAEEAHKIREHEYRMRELELKTQTKGEIDGVEGSSSSPGATHMSGHGYHAMKFPLAVYDQSKERFDQYASRFEA
ncbi:hypothetical protein Tco_0605070, partial [Tanacetum coccineum]